MKIKSYSELFNFYKFLQNLESSLNNIFFKTRDKLSISKRERSMRI